MRVWLPDRPGALGQVASRIGAVQGDVIGIDILERGGGNAIDELTVRLPQPGLVELLVSEIRQVDGVAVEDIRRVEDGRPDAASAGLHAAVALAECAPSHRMALLAPTLRELVDGDWSVVVGLDDAVIVATDGIVPDLAWLTAFLEGSRHLDAAGEQPGDIAWAYLDSHALAVASGRTGRPFHQREREQVALVVRVVDALPASGAA